MSDEQTTPSPEHLPRIKGFISGSPDEQEEQKSIINKYRQSKDFEFFSDWDKMDLKSVDGIIVADLKRLSGNCDVLAARLLAFIKKDIYFEPVNKKQRESLKWRKHSEEFRLVILGIPGGEERALAGLKDLAKQILQGTES